MVATPSVAGVVVAIGASQTVSITFTSSDGLAITGFGISGSGALPAGWSGPGTFTCALVTAGSGCVLNLNYAPVAIDSGTLTINYVYVDNANLPRAPGGSVTISYEAIPQNNVVATASPSGQINAIVGAGNQSVSVNFVTDDGNAATNLAVDLSALPSGWSSTATSLSCAIVSTGNGCELMLTYAPTAAGRGTLTLGYTYTDEFRREQNRFAEYSVFHDLREQHHCHCLAGGSGHCDRENGRPGGGGDFHDRQWQGGNQFDLDIPPVGAAGRLEQHVRERFPAQASALAMAVR